MLVHVMNEKVDIGEDSWFKLQISVGQKCLEVGLN